MKHIFTIFLLTLLTSCGFRSVDQGNVAIVVDSFSKDIHSDLEASGFRFDPFTRYYEVDATDVRVQVDDLQPKDKKGMKFEDVDLTVTVRLNKENAVKFYKETKEINGEILGHDKISQIIKSTTIKAFQKFAYHEFVDDRSVLEKEIETSVKKGIAKLMYGVYDVVDVDTKTINLMPEIEKSFQNRSLVAQKLALVKSKEELIIRELDVKRKEMNKLKEIAEQAGITVKELMDYQIQQERNEVLSDITKSSGSNVLLQVDK